jgi:hypothetical protein
MSEIEYTVIVSMHRRRCCYEKLGPMMTGGDTVGPGIPSVFPGMSSRNFCLELPST